MCCSAVAQSFYLYKEILGCFMNMCNFWVQTVVQIGWAAF